MKSCRELTDVLLTSGPPVLAPAPRSLIRVAGPDAVDFLHRLCSQDVRAMAPGTVLEAAFLDGKGKLLFECLVLRTDDGAWLETRDEQADGLFELLDRYHFSEDLALARGPSGCGQWAGREVPAGMAAGAWRDAGNGVLLCLERGGVVFVRGHGAPVPEGAAMTADQGEVLRMAVGWPRVGVDTEPNTLGPEVLGADVCVVSESKGCYTGQEVVARIKTYGHVNRRLCVLWGQGMAAVEKGAVLTEPGAGAAVGRVMAGVPFDGGLVMTGFLPKDFWAGGTELGLSDVVVRVLGSVE